ncbi:unnamed protein product [Rhizophagus irregularis]|nr:unnamed protein product [Rhizophagus irregularis]
MLQNYSFLINTKSGFFFFWQINNQMICDHKHCTNKMIVEDVHMFFDKQTIVLGEQHPLFILIKLIDMIIKMSLLFRGFVRQI